MELNPELLLTNGTIALRPFRDDDVDAHYEAIHESVQELNPWFGWCTEKYSIKDAGDFISRRSSDWEHDVEYSFVIIENGRIVGGCGINKIDKPCKTASLGYWIRTTRAGRGLATAAAGLLCGWVFNDLDMNRLEILVADSNTKSVRVAEKLGGVREGLLRKRIMVREDLQDAIIFGMINPKLS